MDTEHFWYFGTEYSKYRYGTYNAWLMACREAAALIKRGISIYSPIAHTHPIAVYGEIDPLDHDIWLPADEPFMRAARGMILLMTPDWRTSRGLKHEVEFFTAAEKPIIYMIPGSADAVRSAIDELTTADAVIVPQVTRDSA